MARTRKQRIVADGYCQHWVGHGVRQAGSGRCSNKVKKPGHYCWMHGPEAQARIEAKRKAKQALIDRENKLYDNVEHCERRVMAKVKTWATAATGHPSNALRKAVGELVEAENQMARFERALKTGMM